MIFGIDVIAIGPRSVLTPIWDKAEAADETIYASTDYGSSLKAFKALFIKEGRKGLPAERIGEAIHLALTTPKPKARYAVVPNKFVNWTLPTLLPKRVVDRLIAKRLGLTRHSGAG